LPSPDAYDRAGLWLNRTDAGFQVMDVVAAGPAAEAGLKAGDIIVAVDGQPAKELLLPDVRTRSRSPRPAPGCGSRCGRRRSPARWWWCCGTWC